MQWYAAKNVSPQRAQDYLIMPLLIMNQQILILLSLVLSFLIAPAFAHENALVRAEHSCVKYPPSDARIECVKKEKEAVAALERQRQRERTNARDAEAGPTKKNGLCFTRKATGEMVCPN